MMKYFLVTLLAIQGGIPRHSRPGGNVQGEQLIRTWLGVVDKVPPAALIEISDYSQLPNSVRGNSSLWSQRFFSVQADPHKQQTKVKLRVHLSTEDTPDLLLQNYEFKSWHVSVVESNNFTLIRVSGGADPCSLGEVQGRDFVQTVAHLILNVKDDEHVWRFELPDRLSDGIIFSTNPQVDPLYLAQWSDRADGGIYKGTLFFLCYKKLLSVAGYEDIKMWFDKDFRAKVGQ